MTHLKQMAYLILAFVVGCLANEEAEEDAMVDYLSKHNFLQGKAEIVFLLDRSGSVGRAAFEIEKGFVESFLSHVVVDVNASRVAVISYSDNAVRHIDFLKEPKSKCFLAQQMHDVVYENVGATNTAAAFEEAREVFKNARPNVNKVIVLIGDGIATVGGDPEDLAKRFKEEGVQIFCFGVGRFLKTELEALASSFRHVYTCTGFREFKRLARKVRGDPHESSWSNQNSRPSCDHMCDSIYKGQPDDPGCCDHDALCSCALLSGLHTCVCRPGYYGLSGLIGTCRACPRGTYKSKLEPSSSCTRCPTGSTTAEVASTKLSDCYCKEGYVGDPSKGIPCELVRCPVLQAPAHGYMAECSTVYGSTCLFMCDLPSYELAEQSMQERFCKSNGEWTGKTAVCRKAHCNPPRNPEHGYRTCDAGPLTIGKKCYFQCKVGYFRQGSERRECVSSKKWSGKSTICIPITCELPPRVLNGDYRGCEWNKRPSVFETCVYTCNHGFKLEGPRYLTCRENGKLVDEYGRTGRKPECTDATPPEIFCKTRIMTTTKKGKNSAIVSWEIPLPTDNSGYTPKLKTNPPNIFPNMAFPIGHSTFQYIAIDNAGLNASCIMHIEVVDEEPPAVVKCPSKIQISTNDVQVSVNWEEPVFKDNSNEPLKIYQNAYSGQMFGHGNQIVQYAADDASGNRALCEFHVIVTRSECPYIPAPDNGALACYDWMVGHVCQAYCNERYDFVRKPAEMYICNEYAKWETYPLNELMPWPDCARPTVPGAIRQMVGFYYRGDCNDPQVQHYIKKLFLSHVASNIKYSHLCSRGNTCHVDFVRVLCGKTTDNIFRRRKRGVLQEAASEQLELEFEITIDGDQEFNDTEAVMQDFLEILRNLEWDFDGDLIPSTTLSPFSFQNGPFPNEKESDNTGPLIVTEEKTTLLCKAGSMLIDNICVLCSAGTFYDKDRQECLDCPVGYYQENQGQLLCDKCPNGTSTEYSKTRNGTLCKGICSSGTYSETGLETCLSCPVGTYQDAEGMHSCHNCPNGTTTENVGAISAEDCRGICAPGFFSQNGLDPCQLCPLHHYQSLPGQTACLECPVEQSTAEEGATEADLCIDIDPCLLDSSCVNNGTCIRSGRNAKCECIRGFEGIHCEKDVDECDFSPCSDGGTCINTEGSFYCKCLDGFIGDLCEIEVDECASIPCQNKGTCIDKVNGYTCVCSNGYEGINCEIKRELCFRDVVCLNGGVCMFGEDDNSSFCVCEPGFAGIDCSLDIDECENVTCKNNGSCIDGNNTFICTCSMGYMGMFCEIDIDECENNLCLSGSTCKDLVGAYQCLCPPGWNGTYCENKMNSNFILMFPESTATIANMASATLASPLTDATISLWVQTNDTERSGTPLSYAVASTSTIGANGAIVDNALTISDCSEVKIYVNNEPVVTDLQVADGQWHHLAFTWSSENSGMWALYKDGQLKHKGKNLRPHEIINGGGSLVIGQEQDTLGGGFSPIETFTGNITRVNIWNNYFSKSNITRLCEMDDELPDKVLAWPDFLHGLKGDVQILKYSEPIFSTVV